MPIILNSIVFRCLLRAKVHAVTSFCLFEKDGSLRTNALARLIHKDLHVIFLNIDKVDGFPSTGKYKRVGILVKAWKDSEEILLIISWRGFLDHFIGCSPIMNDQ